ncbi:MAG: phasin family protein [Gammaproteobacteria bacterium]|nr:phasin family protein [Gammaproteobacteria bacterium]
MQNEYLDMVNQYNENVFASFKRIGELNMRTFEALAAKQAKIMNDCLESSAKQMEVMTTAKDVKDALTAQSELLKGCNEKFLANLRETADMMTEAREEFTGLVEEAVKYTSESVEKAGELATNKAA